MSRENQVCFFVLMSNYITCINSISHLIWDSKGNYKVAANIKIYFREKTIKIETQREHSMLVTFLE